MRSLPDAGDFDERWYLETYADVAAAIASGDCPSAWEHFVYHGEAEGRRPRPEFDAAWYAKSYPLARAEAASDDPAILERHYLDRGRGRGYLPAPSAARPRDAAGFKSRFGGLWLDVGNVEDIIAGRLELGKLSEYEAELLRIFVRQGYAILPGAVDAATLDAADKAVCSAYDGKLDSVQFECHSVSPTNVKWAPEVKSHPAKALDLHWLSREVREAVFSPAIVNFLGLIFERPPLASQTLTFYLGSGQESHQDSAYVAYSLPQQFAASWIALEDVTLGAGELEYFLGSHRLLPEFTYGDGRKSVHEARRGGAGDNLLTVDIQRHVGAIQREAASRDLKKERFLAKRGDVLIWHSDLAHGGSPVSAACSRKSIVTHYCPREIVPLFFEDRHCEIHRHGNSYYTTALYGGTPAAVEKEQHRPRPGR
jgi:hypothetical protein